MQSPYLNYNKINILKKIFLFFLTNLLILIVIFLINFKNLKKYDVNLALKLPYITDRIYNEYPLGESYEEIVLLKDIYYRIYETLLKPSNRNFDYKNIYEFMYEEPSNFINLKTDFYLNDKNKFNEIIELINEDLEKIELETKLSLTSYILERKNLYSLKFEDDFKNQIVNVIKNINQEIEFRKKSNKKLIDLKDSLEKYFSKKDQDFSDLYIEYLNLNTYYDVISDNNYNYSDLERIVNFLGSNKYDLEINLKENIFDDVIQYIESKDFNLFILQELTFSKKFSMSKLFLFSIILGSLIFIFMINFKNIIRILKINFKIS